MSALSSEALPVPPPAIQVNTMRARPIALIPLLLLPLAAVLPAQPPPSGLTRLLESQLARFPARTGVYVKHLGTGEEAAVGGDASFSSASVIKIPILIRAFQLADEGTLDLNERVEIRREHLRDGSGIFQYHDLGSTPTYRDLLTQMVITSDNTATDLVVQRIGGVEALNVWLAASGFTHTRMLNRGHQYRQKLLALIDPAFATLTPEETTGLQYASQDSPLFGLYSDLFTGPRARWVEVVRDPANRRALAQHRGRLTVEDRAYWLGDMTPRETGRCRDRNDDEEGKELVAHRELRERVRPILPPRAAAAGGYGSAAGGRSQAALVAWWRKRNIGTSDSATSRPNRALTSGPPGSVKVTRSVSRVVAASMASNSWRCTQDAKGPSSCSSTKSRGGS